MSDPKRPTDDVLRAIGRRTFLQRAATGTVITALGGAYILQRDSLTRAARAEVRADGRPRVPPGQRVIEALKPMGGIAGSPSPSEFRLRVHGEVEEPFELDFAGLLAMAQADVRADVHCVTGWTVLGARWRGVLVRDLLDRAGVKPGGRHVIFEAAHGYTANVRLAEATAPDALVAHRLDGEALARPNGAPVRAVVPALYFWKSPKWLTGIRVVARDQPGYWEVRGYHNHADPWLEERYA